MGDFPFYVDRAKGGRAACKGCKQKCLDGELRMAKLVASPYGEGKMMRSYYHVDCMINMFLKQKVTTKRVVNPEGDIDNWENVSQDDRDLILEKLTELEGLLKQKHGDKYIKPVAPPVASISSHRATTPPAVATKQPPSDNIAFLNHKDNSFREFRRLCSDITNRDAYTAKTAIVKKLFQEGTDGEGFKGNLVMWCRLLLPGAVKRVYNLKSKQLVKLFSRIFNADHDDMLTHLENGDVAETIGVYFERSANPAKKSVLTIQQVDEFLDKLSTLTKEDEQIYHFKFIIPRCTSNDLKLVIRLIKGDLRINAGPKHILEGVHSDAYTLFQSSRDIESVIMRVIKQGDDSSCISSPLKASIKADIMLMTPVLPMLAEACKSVEMAMTKCPNGMISEIKYDGERVQLHKRGNEFKYFSRALKPVMPHKIERFREFIPKAFPHGKDLILDAEVLMVDTKTGKPLPFGSLGKHKKSEFHDAEVCLFVFDCIYMNGEALTHKSMQQRRQVLEDNMIEIKNHVMFSEMEVIKKPQDLAKMIAKVLQLGLEGLVLKDLESKYEPGKRHWLKVKKDYLFDGAMADSADLVVLGAWFGSGKKGGMLSVFLMGCHDKSKDVWLTVTKVHTGHDDKTLEELQEPLKSGMVKISRDTQKVPSWLRCTNTMVPDFIAKDPRKQPVWEITGTELTQAQIHTADGISVRFPRVTRIRDDKNWETATNLDELKILYKNSKEHTDVTLLNKIACQDDDEDVKVEKGNSGKRSAAEKPNRKKKLFTDTPKDEKQTKIHDFGFQSKVKSSSEDAGISDEELKATNKVKIETKYGPRDKSSNSEFKASKKVKIEPQYHPEKPLPNIFNNMTVTFHASEEFSHDLKKYTRHWVLNGGCIDSTQPTHVIHHKNSVSIDEFNQLSNTFSKSVKHVHINWLEKCLQHKKCFDTRDHRVCVKR